MRFAAAIFAAGLLSLSAAHAQLGETREEIARRFGPPVQRNARVHAHRIIGSASTQGDVHFFGGCYVRIVYGNGGCVQAEYSRREGILTADQVDSILTTIAAGSRWQKSPGGGDRITFYRRVDGLALASWTSGLDGSLLIAAEPSGAVWKNLLQQER